MTQTYPNHLRFLRVCWASQLWAALVEKVAQSQGIEISPQGAIGQFISYHFLKLVIGVPNGQGENCREPQAEFDGAGKRWNRGFSELRTRRWPRSDKPPRQQQKRAWQPSCLTRSWKENIEKRGSRAHRQPLPVKTVKTKGRNDRNGITLVQLCPAVHLVGWGLLGDQLHRMIGEHGEKRPPAKQIQAAQTQAAQGRREEKSRSH